MKRILTILFAVLLLVSCESSDHIVNSDSANSLLEKPPTIARGDEYDFQRFDEVIGYNRVNYGNVKYSEFLDYVTTGRGKNRSTVGVYNENKIVEIYIEQSWLAVDNIWRRIKVHLFVEGRDIDWDCGSPLISGFGDNRELNFNAIFDIDNLTADFQPTPFTFASSISMNIEWEEVPQAIYDEFQQGNLFGFIPSDGSTGDTVPYSSITFSDVKNTISVTGAQIPHFSRYGFLR